MRKNIQDNYDNVGSIQSDWIQLSVYCYCNKSRHLKALHISIRSNNKGSVKNCSNMLFAQAL